MSDSNHPSTLSKEQIDSVIALYSNGQYEEAIKQIKELNILYPNQPLLFNLIGVCYKEIGQLEGAAKMFRNAVVLQPSYFEAYFNLGVVLQDMEQNDEAIDSYKKAIAR